MFTGSHAAKTWLAIHYKLSVVLCLKVYQKATCVLSIVQCNSVHFIIMFHGQIKF